MIVEILSAIQCELKAPKNQKNKFGGYNYRSCEDIMEALKPVLAKHKAAVTVNDEIINIGNRFYVKATATLRVGDEALSNSALARECESKKGMDDAQLTGATSSYARKYALNGLFCIDDTKDADDTNTHEQQNTQTPARPNQSLQKETPAPAQTLKERLDACIQFLSAQPDKSLNIADERSQTIISRTQDILNELQTAGRAAEYKQLNDLCNAKLLKAA